jgi:hypothetical protein
VPRLICTGSSTAFVSTFFVAHRSPEEESVVELSTTSTRQLHGVSLFVRQ